MLKVFEDVLVNFGKLAAVIMQWCGLTPPKGRFEPATFT
jgi:hypothetical protein